MKNIVKFLIVLVGVASFSVYAESEIKSVKILQVLAGYKFRNNVILELAKNPAGVPSCHKNTHWHYVFDGTTESGKMTLSIVLAAYAAKKDVWIRGTGDCSLYNGIEGLGFVVAL